MLSTIVVVKNDLARFRQTLESLSLQECSSINDWEILIIDGSDDASAKKTSENFLGLKNLYYHSVPDNSIYEGMNNGIRLSGTRFCHFLNCGDTFYEPYVIERTINALRVGTSSLYIWGFNYSSESLINDARPLTLKDVLSYRNSYCHQSQVISTHLLQKWFFRTDLELCSDFLMTIQILSDYDSDSLGFIGVNYQGLGFSHGKFPDIIYEKRRCILIWYTSLGLIRKVSQFPFFLMGILWNGHPQLFRLMHWLLR